MISDVPTEKSFVSRAFVYTFFDFEPYLPLVRIPHESIIYHVAAIETCPTSGKLHIQGFVRFAKPIRSSAFLKLFSKGEKYFHHTAPRGTDFQNRDYCKKGEQPKDEWDTFGIKGPNYGKNLNLVVEQGTPSFCGKRTDLHTARDFIIEHNPTRRQIIMEIPEVYAKYPRFVRSVQDEFFPPPSVRDGNLSKVNTWIWGPPGTGKDLKARDILSAIPFINKLPNKWFPEGYNGHDALYIADLDSTHKDCLHGIKLWSDRYSCPAEIKGLLTDVNPSHVVITSNDNIDTVFMHFPSVHIDAIKRRFTVINLTEPFVHPLDIQ